MQTHQPKNPSQGVGHLIIEDQAPDYEVFINSSCYDLEELVPGKRLVASVTALAASGPTWWRLVVPRVEPFEGGAHMVVSSAEDLPFEN